MPAACVRDMAMAETVNLKQFRKRAERLRAAKQAETNRARFGRTRAERARDEQRKKRTGELLDQHRVDGEEVS
jgi:hypothetical protein